MAWASPRTWIAGETVTATIMNQHVRDNLNVVSTSFVKGGAWASASGLSSADACAVWYCDHAATLTSVKAIRKGGTGATINARRVRPAAAVGKFFQVDGSAGPAYVDDTTDINNATAADVLPFPASEDTSDYCLFGFASKFRALRYVISTAGTAITATAWEYWNGSTWAGISSVATLTDGGSSTGTTTAFQATASAVPYETSWTTAALTNWATAVINGSAALYWVRCKIATGAYTVNPILTQAWIIEGGDCLASDLSLTTKDEWMDGSTVYNTSFAVGDSLEVILRSVTASPTEVAIQCGMTLA
jgi:hypothetical protein